MPCGPQPVQSRFHSHHTPTGSLMSSQAPLLNSDCVTSADVYGGSTPITSFEDYPIASIEIEKLTLEGSPRLGGEDLQHARVLAGIQGPLPPITVRRQTMQVIDGRHRIRAAQLNGRSVIDARLVECDERTAFALAVRENVTHGLPLSLADRRAAAVSIIAFYPHWSDRVVAEQTGLSDKTVSALRTTGPTPDSAGQGARLGRDGRLRPLNSAAMRRKAAAMLKEDPSAGLREIARSTGLSPATVRDVRIRIDEGKDPVPARYSDTTNRASAAAAKPPRRRSGQHEPPINLKSLLAKLMGDPSLKFNDSGRSLVRWLDRYSVTPESCERQALNIPDHWVLPIASLARNCARAWTKLAEQLERRCTDDATQSARRPGCSGDPAETPLPSLVRAVTSPAQLETPPMSGDPLVDHARAAALGGEHRPGPRPDRASTRPRSTSGGP